MATAYEELETLKKELEETRKVIKTLEYDELTGLFTRQAFLRRGELLLKAFPNKLFGILALDFENFKSANTLYGQDKCSEFLSFIAHRLIAAYPDAVIGRLGGDQFVILYDAHDDILKEIAISKEQILLNSPIPNQSVKFGVYTPIDRDLMFVRCCDRALLALNHIKGIYGKEIAFYEDSLQQKVLDEQKILDSMEKGLAENQFMVYYQPKHDSITGKTAGAEALVRWKHPVYGFMSPGQFIPLFERNGFITKLDTFIIERVCQDINKWKNDGIPLVPVSVNISRRDYLEPDCIENQLKKIDEYGVDHDLIHMEVTESMYSDDTNLIISKVRNTQDAGFMIEMDDFGAGYSSLGMLSSFPLDAIKLDISFVRNIATNKIVIENIIKMAHRMKLVTVAEGVETEEQYKILKSLGCDIIQGYYFSKPLPVLEFEAYLRQKSTFKLKQLLKNKYSLLSQSKEEKMLMVATEIAEGIPGGFYSYHADGDLEIISINSELLSMYDCESAEEFREFSKNSFKGMVHPDDYEEVEASIKEKITPENTCDFVEFRILTKTGRTKFVQSYGKFVETEKYGAIFYVFMYDITDDLQRRRDELQQLKEKLELEKLAEVTKKANNAKRIFIDNFLNDIMPLLKKLNDSTKVIEKNIDNPTVIKDILKNVKNSEERVWGFINNLKENSDLERGNISLKPLPTDCSEAMPRTAQIFSAEAAKKNIKIEYSTNLYNPYIYQDVNATTGVVFNILKNAIKYSPEGSTVKISMNQLPGPTPEECIVEFCCDDKGCGISEDFLPLLFEPFTRENNEINQKIQSSGLGLNIAHELLILMEGTIEVRSKKGEGTIVKTSQPHKLCKKEDVVENSTKLTGKVR